MGFDWAYRNGTPAWDIGRAQPVVERLAEEGAFTGSLIDLGCGTGENALYLAARGLKVTGVDAAPTAIARAREKAAARGLTATFLVAVCGLRFAVLRLSRSELKHSRTKISTVARQQTRAKANNEGVTDSRSAGPASACASHAA